MLLAMLAGVAFAIAPHQFAHAQPQDQRQDQSQDQPQALPPVATLPDIDLQAISGRTFFGQRLPLAALPGEISLGAQRVWTWTESAERPGGEPVTRMYMRGDVRVVLGTYEFAAKGATVWLQRLADAGPEGTRTYQIFVYFDRVSTPSADAAFGISADRLPVRAVLVTDGVTVRADRLEQTRPDEPLVAQGEELLRDHLVAMLTRPVQPPPDTRIVRGPPAGEGTPTPGNKEGGPGPVQDAESPTGEGTPVAARPGEPAPGTPTDPDSGAVSVTGAGPGSRPGEPVTPLAVGADRFPAALTPEDIAGASDAVRSLPSEPTTPPATGTTGTVTFATSGRPDISIARGETENVVIFPKPIVIQYTDRASGRSIQINADRAVAFLKPGPLTQLSTVDADTVRGIFAEGGVMVIGERPISNGSDRYMFRGPAVYYDLANDRAITLDAMFWTYDSARALPLYVRADTIRQESANEWSATRARVANTAFLNPQLSIGASSITLQRRQTPQGTITYADAKNLTGRFAGLPIVWWPRFRGDPSAIPIREVRIDGSSSSGGAIKTTWDAFALLGIDRPSGVDAELDLDYYFERGPAFGTAVDWNTNAARGKADVYLVASDAGQDTLKTGEKKDGDGDTRGMILAEHRWQISDAWSILLEGAYISDETFIDGFFESMGENRREFATSITARRLGPNSLLTFQGKGSLNDFIANEYLLQSQGYAVSKLPEASYWRVADDLLPNLAPGVAMYHSEWRLGRVGLQFSEPSAADLGFTKPTESMRAFATAPGVSFQDVLEASGLSESAVTRFDTRHEIETRLRFGALNFEPFMVGRLTAYDDDFDEYSPGNDDQARFWGASGFRASTSIQRVNNAVESSVFDLHRMRHIIEPSLTFWVSGTNVESGNLPIYDSQVEDLTNGTAARFAIDQTWQTQRGGPGRWRSVDVLTLDVEYGVFSDDSDRKSPIRRFIDYRPEHSQPGEFFSIDSTWQATEVVGLGGNIIYDLELNQPARESIGAIVQHTPDLQTYVEMRYINVEDTTLMSFGAAARITPKYTLGFNASYDTDEGDFQNNSVTLYRELQALVIQATIGYNNITGETSGGLTIYPEGAKGRALQVTPVGASDIRFLDRDVVTR